MPKNQPVESNVSQGVARDTADDITLDEFCQRKSRADKRVELIGGFHHNERQANHVKDSEANFEIRFAAFINKPV